MKGTIFTAVLICSAILAACSPAAPREAMASTQSPSPSPAEEPADETSEEAYHKITAEEAKQMMDEGNATVVDVRTAEEYAAGHIPDSILVPVESIALRTSWWNWDTNMYMILAELWTGPMKQ